MKQYDILTIDTGENVLGGHISEKNAYIAAYPRPKKGQKHPLALGPGESCICRYSLSGSTGDYRVVRLKDDPTREC